MARNAQTMALRVKPAQACATMMVGHIANT
jgi:hypothetical protein